MEKPKVKKVKAWIEFQRKVLYRGCGGYQNYWGHECKSTFVNTSKKKVTVYCDSCTAKLELLRQLSRFISPITKKKK
jgi:hypothetical protein